MHPRRRLILERLRDEDPDVRARASEALDRLDLLESLPGVARRLRDLEREAWVRLLRALVDVRAEAGLRIAVAGLAHPDEDVRVAALEVVEAYRDWRATSRVVERLGDPAPVVRARAAQVLGSLGDPRAADSLRTRLGDPSAEVVVAAVRALGLLGHTPSEGDLMELARHREPRIRAAAVEALGRLGFPPPPGPRGG